MTAVPSLDPVETFFGNADAQAGSRPEPVSEAVNRLETAETYQPFAPGVPLWTPASWMTGASVSSTIVSVAVAETFPAASRYCAQTVFAPSPDARVWGIVWAKLVVAGTPTQVAAEQSLPFATR